MSATEKTDLSGTKVGFVGLGVMGFPMAGHLAAAGCHVTVYNRTAAVAERWLAEHSGATASTPREVARLQRCGFHVRRQ